jgi:INO80 complex subunit C
MIPAKKYCDITGFETRYKDKNSGLYYYDKFVYKYIQGLTKPVIDEYLKLRKINITN